MAIIIRLEGLGGRAGTEDIRSFFECLHIPDGGVYILGGRLKEAFIAFNSERDAQLAMRQTGMVLNGSKVNLYVSSMAELEHKLKSLLKKRKTSIVQPTVEPQKARQHPHFNGGNLSPKTADVPPKRLLDPRIKLLDQQAAPGPPLDTGTAFLLGICTVLQGLQPSPQDKTLEVNSTTADSTFVSDEVMTQEQSLESSPGYVRLFGLPSLTTKDDISQFFRGLSVQEAIVNVKLGIKHGCLVKFANLQDAREALLFNQHQLSDITVEVRSATEKMWTSALEEAEDVLDDEAGVECEQISVQDIPSLKCRSLKRRHNGPTIPLIPKPVKKRRSDEDLPNIPPSEEYIVKVTNLPQTMTKTEIKELFGCTNIPHKHVLHYLDKEGNRTDTAFIIFKHEADYDYAVNLNGCHVGSSAIEVTAITRFIMRDMMAKTHPRNQKFNSKIVTKSRTNQRICDTFEALGEKLSGNSDLAAQTCLYVRNMPADVKETHIKGLFCKYKLAKENIFLLRDGEGKCTGEAVVQFTSPKLAVQAQRLHKHKFLGSKVLLTLISVKQMKDILGQ